MVSTLLKRQEKTGDKCYANGLLKCAVKLMPLPVNQGIYFMRDTGPFTKWKEQIKEKFGKKGWRRLSLAGLKLFVQLNEFGKYRDHVSGEIIGCHSVDKLEEDIGVH
jgi:hypothetical protein